MCRKYPEMGGKIFVTENSGIGPKKLLLIKQIIFLQSHFNWWDKTYKIIPRRAFQFVSRIFFGKPSQKDSEYTTYKYVFNVADKEFSQKYSGWKIQNCGKVWYWSSFCNFPNCTGCGPIGKCQKGSTFTVNRSHKVWRLGCPKKVWILVFF